MLGTFHNDQPEIEIEVKGTSDTPKKVTALVDSGFNGYLTLPYVEAFPLGLILKGIQSNILADGSSSEHFVCAGEVCVVLAIYDMQDGLEIPDPEVVLQISPSEKTARTLTCCSSRFLRDK